MAEAGGPTTQAGIYYQNTIAALYLGRMLDLRSRAARDRVIRVRVEAPDAVDDLVAEMADISRIFLQAKIDVDVGSAAWVKLWQNFAKQLESNAFGTDDHLRLVLGIPTSISEAIRGASERASTAKDVSEWQLRLTAGQERIVRAVADVLPTNNGYSGVWKILRRSVVEVIPHDTVDRDYAPLWMPESPIEPKHLLATLRDIAGGASRIRGSFDASTLRARLQEECGIEIREPETWGGTAYRAAVMREASVMVPGTGYARPIADAFLWPQATRYDKSRPFDFDDETPRSVVGVRTDEINLVDFGSPNLDKVVVVAGPGMGKSLLTVALSYKAATEGRLPVIVPIPDLSRLDLEISEFLTQEVNRRFQIKIDWQAAAESGLLVLFLDGLDEVATARRAVVLERIRRFSARFPLVSWMLTVRDAAALAAPTDAMLVELEPLSDNEIQRFLELSIPNDAIQVQRVQRRIDASPDLTRLVRIPLFLALLIATIRDRGKVPENRTELLEAYMDLLFRPEQYKGGGDAEPDPFMLRELAQAIAFQALEREEIGFDAKLATTVIRERLGRDTLVEPLLERLVRCGIVRRTGPRLEFPFPIVQEYLAACEIQSHRLPEVPDRIVSAIKRPWAQALQFVLEQHPHPESIVIEILAAPDDAFHTNLRLLARSVANGMRITAESRAEIARRLARIWPTVSWRSVQRIGELIADAFTDPLVPELRNQLGQRWNLHSGGGAIVARIANPALTRAVLQELLDGDIEWLLHLYELQDAVDALGDEALNMYVARARKPGTTESEQHGLAALIKHLNGSLISTDLRLAVALDHEFNPQVRLAAFCLSGSPVDSRAIPLVREGLASEDWRLRSTSLDVLPFVPDPLTLIRNVLLREELPMEVREAVADYLPHAIESGLPKNLFKVLAAEPGLDESLRARLLIFSARFGDEGAMESLISNLMDEPLAIISPTLALLGYYRSRPLVARAVEALRKRQLSPSERVQLAWNIVLGMTAIYEMWSFDFGGIKPAPLHPGADYFRSLLEEWAEADDYDLEQSMRLNMELVLLGSSDALTRLPLCVEAVFKAHAMDLNDSDQASRFGNAIRALHENHRLLPLSLLEQIAMQSSWNVLLSVGPMMVTHGSREAFDTLLRLYVTAPDRQTKAYILELLEPLAGRLELRVWNVEGQIEVRAD